MKKKYEKMLKTIYNAEDRRKFEYLHTYPMNLFLALFGEDNFNYHDCRYTIDNDFMTMIVETFLLNTITEREAGIIKCRFKFDMTLEETGSHTPRFYHPENGVTITKERVRSIEARALRKLRHTSCSKIIKPFINAMMLPYPFNMAKVMHLPSTADDISETDCVKFINVMLQYIFDDTSAKGLNEYHVSFKTGENPVNIANLATKMQELMNHETFIKSQKTEFLTQCDVAWFIIDCAEKQKYRDMTTEQFGNIVYNFINSNASKSISLRHMSVYELGLNVRTLNAMTRSGKETVGDILDWITDANHDISDIRNFGEKSYQNLIDCLVEHGIIKNKE